MEIIQGGSTVLLFHMADASTGLPATGLTCSGFVFKNSTGSTAVSGSSGEFGDGWYGQNLDSNDTNTLGSLGYVATASGAYMDVGPGMMRVVSADSQVVNAKIGTPASTVSDDIAAVKTVADGIDTDTGDILAKIGTPDATVSADISAVKSDSAAIKTKTDQLTFTTPNVVDSSADVTIAAADVADAVWDESRAGHVSAGSFGEYTLANIVRIAGAPVAVDTGTAGTVSFVSGEYVATSGGTVNANVTQIDGENVTNDGNGTLIVKVVSLYDPGTDSYLSPPSNFSLLQVAAGGHVFADTIKLNGTAQTGRDIGASVLVGDKTGFSLANGSFATATFGTCDFTATMKTSIGTAVAASAVASVTGNIGGNVVGSVGSVTGLTASNLDAAVSTRLPTSSYTAPDNSTISSTASAVNAVGVLATAIKAKTDNLPSDPADASDIATSFASLAATLATIAGYIDTEVAAIKAKTDNLPASPAATGDVPTTAAIATALLAKVYEGTRTVQDYLRLSAAIQWGKASGLEGASPTFRDDSDAKNRIAATYAAGARGAPTLDAT